MCLADHAYQMQIKLIVKGVYSDHPLMTLTLQLGARGLKKKSCSNSEYRSEGSGVSLT